jgi:hypothetical protein
VVAESPTCIERRDKAPQRSRSSGVRSGAGPWPLAAGGGTRLTAKGLDCVRRFRRLTAGLQDLIEPRFAEVFEAS